MRLNEILVDIKKNVLLTHSNYEKPFSLYTDACNIGIGGVITQESKLIGLCSYKLNEVETRYTIVEKEMLAVVKCLRHFRNILFGSTTYVLTDNKNNTYLKERLSNRMQRWSLEISEMDIKFEYLECRKNQAADFLSRMFLCKKLDEVDNAFISEIKQYIKEGVTIDSKPIVEGICTLEFVTKIHECLGHPGSKRLANTIKRYYNVKSLAKNCTKVLKNCIKCQENKNFRNNNNKLTVSY